MPVSPLTFKVYLRKFVSCPHPSQICGEASYWGRRAFEQHFTDWKHVQGLRALGIRMSKEFFEITSIAEAQALWENLKKRDTGYFVADVDEECEDEEGNVYNRKTYMDLKRQGII